MDCVTCVLVGMCIMCRPGIGRSNRGANEPGRPMTEAEVNQALSKLVSHFRPTTRRPPLRRQSFVPDIRFTDVGIGKRGSDDVENENLSEILGKNVPAQSEGSEKRMVDLLFWPAIRRALRDLKRNEDFTRTYRQSSEDVNKHLGKLPSSEKPTVDWIMNKLKRTKLEELLLKKIAQGSSLAIELEKTRTKR